MAIQNQESGKVTILGYTESFALNPSVKIYKDGREIGKVGRHEKLEIDVDETCELTFKSSWHTERRVVKPGDWVLLSFNRFWGTLNSTLTDKDNYQFAINKAHGDDVRNWIWTFFFIAVCAVAAYFLLS